MEEEKLGGRVGKEEREMEDEGEVDWEGDREGWLEGEIVIRGVEDWVGVVDGEIDLETRAEEEMLGGKVG